MKSNNQNGGTLAGLIIGLVIGLGIAIAVAFMITKTPAPFANKLGLNNAPELPQVQLADPNKPLYGHAYQEPAADQSPTAPEDAGARPSDNPDQRPEDGSSSKADAHASIANPTNTKPDTPKNNPDEKAAYYLQVGAFSNEADAESVRAKLALLGVESSVSTKSTTEGDHLYRVRIGPFDHLDAMNRMRSKLSENSIDVAVIKTPK